MATTRAAQGSDRIGKQTSCSTGTERLRSLSFYAEDVRVARSVVLPNSYHPFNGLVCRDRWAREFATKKVGMKKASSSWPEIASDVFADALGSSPLVPDSHRPRLLVNEIPYLLI